MCLQSTVPTWQSINEVCWSSPVFKTLMKGTGSSIGATKATKVRLQLRLGNWVGNTLQALTRDLFQHFWIECCISLIFFKSRQMSTNLECFLIVSRKLCEWPRTIEEPNNGVIQLHAVRAQSTCGSVCRSTLWPLCYCPRCSHHPHRCPLMTKRPIWAF